MHSGDNEKQRSSLFQIHINVYDGVLYNTCSSFCLMYCLYFVLNKKLLLVHFLFYGKKKKPEITNMFEVHNCT